MWYIVFDIFTEPLSGRYCIIYRSLLNSMFERHLTEKFIAIGDMNIDYLKDSALRSLYLVKFSLLSMNKEASLMDISKK